MSKKRCKKKDYEAPNSQSFNVKSAIGWQTKKIKFANPKKYNSHSFHPSNFKSD